MKKITTYLENAKKIRYWMLQREQKRIPSQRSKNQTEHTLANALNSIKRDVINPYIQLETEEQRAEFKKRYPEIDELLEIYNEIVELRVKQKTEKENSRLQYAKEIEAWLEKNKGKKIPSALSKDEEERRLGIAYKRIREQLINPFKKLQTEQEREEFRKKHPHIDEILELLPKGENVNSLLKNIKLIKAWMEKNSPDKSPSQASKDIEESRLADALANVRSKVKVYLELQSEEEKEVFRARLPEIDEIIEILQQIENMRVPLLVRNARMIRDWVLKNENKQPSPNSDSPEEKKLGIALNNIKMYRIKPYKELKTEEERAKFLEEYPDTQEILDTLYEVLEKREHPYLVNARLVKKWLEDGNATYLPRLNSKNVDPEERRFGIKLNNIYKNRVTPFLKLNSEQERQEYREKHPEIDEIMDIISEITEKYGRKRLKKEIDRNSRKLRQLEQARELESNYECLLVKKINANNIQVEGVGVESDER